MRNLFKATMVMAILFIIAGCYDSEVPMAPVRDAVFDAKLIGKWKQIDTKDDETSHMVILNFNDREYFVRFKLMEKKDWSVSAEVYLCRAYTIMVDGVAFCNVQYISSNEKDKRPFMFFRYSISKDGILTWRWINNNLIKTKIKTSKELYVFIKKNRNNEKLYGKPLKFKKLI
ncbi:MAG: hypothetical protein JRI92_07300 [Deltaproteobacteria bacterium]|nr:hypothetical protein [Deltaproteobacteria bacterium]